MENLSVQAVESDFNEKLKYAQANGFGMELATFAFAEILDTRWKVLLGRYKKELKGFSGTLSMHGAFHDLILNSRDSLVRKVAEKRILHNMLIAKELKAEYIVFHSNFNSMIRNESYRKNWIEVNSKFWKFVCQKYGITICIENLWEKNPAVLRELFDVADSQKLKLCLDTGHVNIFSEVPISKWFSVLKKDIAYIHVNDNKGKLDSELVPGEGTINWRNFSTLVKRNGMNPKVVFEVGSETKKGLENTMKSVEYFRKNKIYPF